MKISYEYKVDSFTLASLNINEVPVVKDAGATGVEAKLELVFDASELPEVITALARLKSTVSGDKIREVGEQVKPGVPHANSFAKRR